MTQQKNKTHNGWLLSGAGNTFAIEITELNNKKSSQEAAKICAQQNVDGYLGLIPEGPAQFRWNFYNSDGSVAEFCGNAARCAQEYVFQSLHLDKSKYKTLAGEVESWTELGKSWVLMPLPKIQDPHKKIKIEEDVWQGLWCDTGVPHFVCLRPQDKTEEELRLLSRKLRSHAELSPRGANITWVTQPRGEIVAVTYERGVEDFTQACGTGAMAAALWWQLLEKEKKEFLVHMPGGKLQILHDETGWRMTGPVQKLGEWRVHEKN